MGLKNLETELDKLKPTKQEYEIYKKVRNYCALIDIAYFFIIHDYDKRQNFVDKNKNYEQVAQRIIHLTTHDIDQNGSPVWFARVNKAIDDIMRDEKHE